MQLHFLIFSSLTHLPRSSSPLIPPPLKNIIFTRLFFLIQSLLWSWYVLHLKAFFIHASPFPFLFLFALPFHRVVTLGHHHTQPALLSPQACQLNFGRGQLSLSVTSWLRHVFLFHNEYSFLLFSLLLQLTTSRLPHFHLNSFFPSQLFNPTPCTINNMTNQQKSTTTTKILHIYQASCN